jgi:hypothetical protein
MWKSADLCRMSDIFSDNPFLGGRRCVDDVITPNSWFNPFSWDWGHILSATWNEIRNNCLSGAAQGVVGTASGTTIVNLPARGGKITPGPGGYAAIAIGGCVVSMLW